MAVVALMAAIGPVAAANGEFQFAPSRTLSVEEAAQPRVAVDPQGRATVVWEALGPEATALIQVVRLNAFGLPGPVRTLDQFPKHAPQCPCPQVAVDPYGRATITWQAYDGVRQTIKAVQMDASEALGPTSTLSDATKDAWDQQLAADPQGRVTIIWRYPSEGGVESVRLGLDGQPEDVNTLAEGNGAGLPDVAVGPEGRATAVWPTTEGLKTAQLDASGAPGPTQDVPSTGNSDGAVNVVVDSRGRATIAWWRGSGAYEAKSVRLDSAGVPGAVQNLSPPEQDTYEPYLAVDPQDGVTAIWQDFEDRVHAVRLDEDGIPEAVHTVSGDGRAGEPRVTSRPGGGAVVVWSHPAVIFIFPPKGECLDLEFDPESDVVEAAFLGPDGQTEQISRVSSFGEQSLGANVATDALSRPTVVWQSYDGTYFCDDWDTRVQASRGSEAPEVPPELGSKPPVPSEPPPSLSESLLRLSNRAYVNGRHLVLSIRCSGGGGVSCAGEVKLLRRSHVFARGRYRLSVGRRTTIRLPLSKYGQALARRGSRGLVLTTGKGRRVETGVVWVRLPRRPH